MYYERESEATRPGLNVHVRAAACDAMDAAETRRSCDPYRLPAYPQRIGDWLIAFTASSVAEPICLAFPDVA